MKITWLFLSVGFLLLSAGSSHAICYSTKFQLERDNKEKSINQILEYGRCVRAEERERVGKYFCFVDRMVGIQVDEKKQVNSGRIKPDPEKFFVTIKERDDDKKRIACDGGIFGLNNDLGESYGNSCLANYDIEFSPSMGIFHSSADTYHFFSAEANFTLYGGKQFVLFQNEQGNNYLSRGLCEKIN